MLNSVFLDMLGCTSISSNTLEYSLDYNITVKMYNCSVCSLTLTGILNDIMYNYLKYLVNYEIIH